MFKRGIAFSLSLAMCSVALGGAEIQLIPDNPGPYNGNEQITVDVVLVQNDGVTSNRALRMVQLDLTQTHPDVGLPPGSAWDFSSTPHCMGTPAECGINHYIDISRNDSRPCCPNVLAIAYGSDGTNTSLGQNLNEQLVLPGDGSPLTVAQLRVGVPNADGLYTLDVMNASEADPDRGAQVRWGFGTNIDGNPLTTWRPGGDLTGGTMEICVGVACVPNALAASTPACDVSLTRPSNSVVRLQFTAPIADPVLPGQVEIRELLDAGGLGADISDQFTFTVEGGNVLRIAEAGTPALVSGTWYGILNTGNLPGVAPFEVDYKAVHGDANNSGFTNFADLATINANFVDPTNDWDLNDINASGFVNFADLAAAFSFNGDEAPDPKPSGHTCTIP